MTRGVTVASERARVRVRSDTPAQARHRAHQSAYRAEVLGLPAGPPVGVARHIYRVLGSYLPVQHDGVSAAEAGWNLMSAAARSYARDRLDVASAASEPTDAERFWRNMLSSRSLAFSIAGELRAHETAALAVLGCLSGLDLASFDRLGDPWALDGLQAEWAPPGEGPRFDIAAAVRTTAGERVLVTIDVEYVDEVADLGASQVPPSALGGFDKTVALVLCRADDAEARQACRAAELASALRTHEDLFDAAADEPALHDWAQAMRRRYLTS